MFLPLRQPGMLIHGSVMDSINNLMFKLCVAEMDSANGGQRRRDEKFKEKTGCIVHGARAEFERISISCKIFATYKIPKLSFPLFR